MFSLCRYAKVGKNRFLTEKEREMTQDQVVDLISEKSTVENRGIWTEIAGTLPNRTVQACHNILKRRFSPYNYKGRWTSEQESLLLHLVESEGRKWKEIGA